MEFDFNRLRLGERIAAASGLALFIFMFFFKWFGLKGRLGDLAAAGGYNSGFNAWHGLTIVRWFLLLAVIIAIGSAVLTATQRTVALPVAGSVLTAAIGILVSILVFIRVIVNHPFPHDLVGTKAGAYLGLLSCIGIAVGGWLAMRDEGATFSQAGAQLDRSLGNAGRGQSRPAPPAHAPEESDLSTPAAPTPPPASPSPLPPSNPATPSDPAAPGPSGEPPRGG
ncbi:MAG TPA: hypothetical protein VGN69_01665 [Solirubrobacteraceae bacterium]|jgi:hypothetical protein|nr:hypothetical protein [Solirubrobacteraceae bacterium]